MSRVVLSTKSSDFQRRDFVAPFCVVATACLGALNMALIQRLLNGIKGGNARLRLVEPAVGFLITGVRASGLYLLVTV